MGRPPLDSDLHVKQRIRLYKALAQKQSCRTEAAKHVSNIRLSGSLGKILMADIKAIVLAYFGVDETEFSSRRRDKWTVHARHIAIYFCCELTPNPYSQVARMLGNIDHSSAIYARRKIAMHIDNLETKEDLKIKKYIDELRDIFKDWQ